jgi:NADH dehydrogenase/NADH:ubiquinone oxidoreductase subunit G
MTNEEGRAFLDLTKSLGATARFVAPPAGPADELLYTGDPCPNRKGLTDLGLAPATAEEVNELAKGAKACLLAGEFAVELLRLTPGGDAFLANGKLPVLTLERRALDAPAAAICFPAYNVYEKSGTFTNRQGLTQSLRPAIAPPPGARSDLETLEKLKEAVLASGHAAAKGAH